MSFPLVLINGWAMPESVLEPLLSSLGNIELTVINLSDIPLTKPDDLTLGALVSSLNSLLPEKQFVLAGWSYGGTLACAYATVFPKKVKALLTLATNPCFVMRPDWQAGMARTVFSDFLTSFKKDPEKTLRQFSTLCSIGSRDKKN